MKTIESYIKEIENPPAGFKEWEQKNWDNLRILFGDYCSEMRMENNMSNFHDFCTYMYKETSHGNKKITPEKDGES